VKEMRRARKSRFQASHAFTPGRSGSGSQGVIVVQIAVQQPLYIKLTITWMMELIDTRRQVDTNKITLL